MLCQAFIALLYQAHRGNGFGAKTEIEPGRVRQRGSRVILKTDERTEE